MTDSEDAEMVIEQLTKIAEFLEVSRRFGFSMTATPQGVALLRQSADKRAERLLENLCPVLTDPWSDCWKREGRR